MRWTDLPGFQNLAGLRSHAQSLARSVAQYVPGDEYSMHKMLLDIPTRIGERIFVKTDDVTKVQQIACHELVHAFTSHLRLPVWLHEGLAMVTVDRLLQNQSIQGEK
jgi:hypothetical protein